MPSYADFHCEITKEAENFTPKTPGHHHNHQVPRKTAETDELVKHMSNLPSYLERGENIQEKAFNVGVLDWGRLEKWKYNNQHLSCRDSGHSPSSNNVSSYSTTDVFSMSSRGQICYPTYQMTDRPMLQSHNPRLKVSPRDELSQNGKSFQGNGGKFHDLKVAQNNISNDRIEIPMKDQPFCKKHLDTKQEEGVKRDADTKIIPIKETSQLPNDRVASCPQGKMRSKDVEYAKKMKKSEMQSVDSSKRVPAKSHTKEKVISACSDSMSGDKNCTTSKSRSSSLRRIHGPLLKPKTVNCHGSAKPLRKDSVSMDKACISSHRRKVSTLKSLKYKLDLSSCKSVHIDDTHESRKKVPSTVQALFQVAVKNGLPLLTFAVDNSSDILAATVRRLSTSKKIDNKCLYTFFTVREIKKKIWLSQAGKCKAHDCIPNVIAQMEVSDSQFSRLFAPHLMDHYIVREFVLSSADFRQGEQRTTHFRPNNELAAILLKIPKEINGSSYVGTTVIIPGSVHTVPSKGEPSSLVERWKSGGVCDCGGWDLGCKLKVLTDLEKPDKKLRSSNVDRYELFYQGHGNHRVFSLAPFKEGVFSAEFDSSLSLLQAFSICIAALDCRKLTVLPESRTSFERKSSEETTLLQTVGINPLDGVQTETPARHVSIPPPPPVERF